MLIDINEEGSYVTSSDTGTTLEISANEYSYKSEHNKMIIRFRAYGYHDSKTQIDLIEGD